MELAFKLWFRWDNWLKTKSYENYLNNFDEDLNGAKIYLLVETTLELIINYFLMVYLFLGAISEQEVDEEKALYVFTAAKDDESLPIVTNLMTNEPNFAV